MGTAMALLRSTGRGRRAGSARWGLTGQTQRALADDVALDLVRAAVDRVSSGEEEHLLRRGEEVPAGFGGVVLAGEADHALGALDVERQLTEVAVQRRPVELRDHRRTGELARRCVDRQDAQRVPPQDLQPAPQRHDPLAYGRVVEPA